MGRARGRVGLHMAQQGGVARLSRAERGWNPVHNVARLEII